MPDFFDQIYQAALDRNKDELDTVIQLVSIDINKIAQPYFSPLSQLAMEGNEDACRWLMSHGANINYAIYGAALGKKTDFARQLLKEGALMGALVFGAAQTDDHHFVRELLEKKGASRTFAAAGYAKSGQREQLERLLSFHNINLSAVVSAAASGRQWEIMDDLIALGAHFCHVAYGIGLSCDTTQINQFLSEDCTASKQVYLLTGLVRSRSQQLFSLVISYPFPTRLFLHASAESGDRVWCNALRDQQESEEAEMISGAVVGFHNYTVNLSSPQESNALCEIARGSTFNTDLSTLAEIFPQLNEAEKERTIITATITGYPEILDYLRLACANSPRLIAILATNVAKTCSLDICVPFFDAADPTLQESMITSAKNGSNCNVSLAFIKWSSVRAFKVSAPSHVSKSDFYKLSNYEKAIYPCVQLLRIEPALLPREACVIEANENKSILLFFIALFCAGTALPKEKSYKGFRSHPVPDGVWLEIFNFLFGIQDKPKRPALRQLIEVGQFMAKKISPGLFNKSISESATTPPEMAPLRP